MVGLDEQLIEDTFVPIMILRNEFDVGHGRLALHDIEDLQLVYGLIIGAEQEFRKLLNKIVTEFSAGSIKLPPYKPNSQPSYSRPMRGVIEALRKRTAGKVEPDPS